MADGGLDSLVKRRASSATDGAGRRLHVLEESRALDIADETGESVRAVFSAGLRQGICPRRYIRNLGTLSVEEQLRLAESTVAVVGAGGLGGEVIVLLARLGVGYLRVVDSDRFEESNLNRQSLCTRTTLGRRKAEAARDAVSSINPGVSVASYPVKLVSTNAAELLREADVVVDGLDNVRDRLLLEAGTRDLGIPLIHGAVAGFEGRLMSVFPGDPGLRLLYGGEIGVEEEAGRAETELGVPCPVPALIGVLQAMEVVKHLLGRGKVFHNAMLHVDLETGDFIECPLGEREGEEN